MNKYGIYQKQWDFVKHIGYFKKSRWRSAGTGEVPALAKYRRWRSTGLAKFRRWRSAGLAKYLRWRSTGAGEVPAPLLDKLVTVLYEPRPGLETAPSPQNKTTLWSKPQCCGKGGYFRSGSSRPTGAGERNHTAEKPEKRRAFSRNAYTYVRTRCGAQPATPLSAACPPTPQSCGGANLGEICGRRRFPKDVRPRAPIKLPNGSCEFAACPPPALSRTGEKAAKSVKERTVVHVEVPDLRSAPGASSFFTFWINSRISLRAQEDELCATHRACSSGPRWAGTSTCTTVQFCTWIHHKLCYLSRQSGGCDRSIPSKLESAMRFILLCEHFVLPSRTSADMPVAAARSSKRFWRVDIRRRRGGGVATVAGDLAPKPQGHHRAVVLRARRLRALDAPLRRVLAARMVQLPVRHAGRTRAALHDVVLRVGVPVRPRGAGRAALRGGRRGGRRPSQWPAQDAPSRDSAVRTASERRYVRRCGAFFQAMSALCIFRPNRWRRRRRWRHRRKHNPNKSRYDLLCYSGRPTLLCHLPPSVRISFSGTGSLFPQDIEMSTCHRRQSPHF
eukprot:gene1917-biopygen7883